METKHKIPPKLSIGLWKI